MGNAFSQEDDEEVDAPRSPQLPEESGMDAGVFHVQENLMQQERVVAEMETSSLLLNEYHQQLDSVANLSMLLLGFVMVGLCGSELNVIADPQYATCYSKSTAHFVFTLLLLLSTELCVCFCLLCIAGATYAVHVGRHAYLHVGWLVAVYRTQAFVYKVHTWFFLAGCCFLVSLSAYGWKFLGVSLLIDVSDTASEYADDAVVTTQGGATLLVKCLDVTNDAQVRRHHLMGVALASVISIVLLASAVYGIYTIGVSWRRTYVRDQADPELLRLRRKVEVDKLNWRRAQREATRLERACQEANETAP